MTCIILSQVVGTTKYTPFYFENYLVSIELNDIVKTLIISDNVFTTGHWVIHNNLIEL